MKLDPDLVDKIENLLINRASFVYYESIKKLYFFNENGEYTVVYPVDIKNGDGECIIVNEKMNHFTTNFYHPDGSFTSIPDMNECFVIYDVILKV